MHSFADFTHDNTYMCNTLTCVFFSGADYDILKAIFYNVARNPYNIRTDLEDNHGFEICDHERDFIGGRMIAENIEHAILYSRRMIVILTE